MPSDLFKSADWLSINNNNGFGLQPIPSKRDAEITALLEQWLDLDPEHRILSASNIREDQRFTLLAYSERCASQAVRGKDPELIFKGLLALGLDGWLGDWRDNAVLLALHYDGAKRIGSDPADIFHKAGSLLSTKVAEAFRKFIIRFDEDKSLESMGYTVGNDNGGFLYRRTW